MSLGLAVSLQRHACRSPTRCRTRHYTHLHRNEGNAFTVGRAWLPAGFYSALQQSTNAGCPTTRLSANT